jgi:hypothetical protein
MSRADTWDDFAVRDEVAKVVERQARREALMQRWQQKLAGLGLQFREKGEGEKKTVDLMSEPYEPEGWLVLMYLLDRYPDDEIARARGLYEFEVHRIRPAGFKTRVQ